MRAAAFFQHQETAGTDGGTATSGSWQDRKITNVISDLNSLISLDDVTGIITVQPGNYIFDALTPFAVVDACKSRLINADTSAVLLLSVNAQSASSASNQTTARIYGILQFTAVTRIKIQSQVTSTRATTGFGIANGFATEVYTQGSISVLG